MRPQVALLVLLPALGLAGPAAAELDWSRYAEVDTVEVLTTDEDGEARATTVWLLVLEGQAFLRTSDTTWGGNVERNPKISLRIAEEEIPVRAAFVSDPDTRAQVTRGFRQKYGFMDRLTDLIRSSDPTIMRLEPR